jgi:alpha-galactosidase
MAAVGYPKLAPKTKFAKLSITIAIAMTLAGNSSPNSGTPEVVARYIDHDLSLDAGKPADEWKLATPIVFDSDWQGRNPDPGRETQVRLLWNSRSLYLRFECRYREIHVFDDAEKSGHRDHLWDRDVAEAFLQPDPSRPTFYREFEVSPNGMWIDLDIFPAGLADLKSGMQRSVILDEKRKTWIAELSIPLKALTPHFDPKQAWRANFYRVEGSTEPRNYLAWNPTNTPEPNFHVPARFGVLKFQK